MKYCDSKCQVVVGENWLFVTMSIISRNVSRYAYVLLSCPLFLVSAYARMKSVLCENRPVAVPFRMFRSAPIAESRSMVQCCALLFVVLFLVVLVVSCLCLGYSCLDVVDGKVICSEYSCLISSHIFSGDCDCWNAMDCMH